MEEGAWEREDVRWMMEDGKCEMGNKI